MTAAPATVRSVMRIYHTGIEPQIVKVSFGEYHYYNNLNGNARFEFRPLNSAPVEFVRWPEKTK